MSFKTFSFQEMLTLTGENAATLRNDRRHGQTVAAFGTARRSPAITTNGCSSTVSRWRSATNSTTSASVG